MIVPRPVIVQARAIIFASGVSLRVTARAGLAGLAVWLIGVTRRDGTGAIGHRYRAAERIGEKTLRAAGIGAAVDLIDTQAGQYVCRRDIAGVEFLNDVDAVVEELGRRAGDGLALSPPGGVVLKTRRYRAVDRGQLVAGVPGVGVGAVAREIAVEVVAVRGRALIGEAVVGVECGAGHGCRQTGARIGAVLTDAPASEIVAVRERAEGSRAFLVGEAGVVHHPPWRHFLSTPIQSVVGASTHFMNLGSVDNFPPH